MKKSIKILLLIISILLILFMSFLTYCLIVTKDVKLNKIKLVDMGNKITLYDNFNKQIEDNVDGKKVTNLSNIPKHVLDAFVSIEDKRFYQHNGIDYKGLFRAIFNNIKSFSFKEGASTISQQLIKNTHLTNEKTLKRKLIEMKLSRQLEKNYSKRQILEMYVNTIYFGDGCYGITNASIYYFNKQPTELSINEGATLAGIIKAPSIYSPTKNLEKCKERKDIVLQQMKNQKFISESDFLNNYKKNIQCNLQLKQNNNFNYISMATKEFDEIIENMPHAEKNYKVYTYFDAEKQNLIENTLKNDNTNCGKSGTIINKQNKICAYYSDFNDMPRQIGSTIKPILIYAPAIELNNIYSCSKIKDEKVDFNGFNVSNYKDKYYGDVSAKFSLAKSLNSCAVKLLNSVGIEKCKNFAKKTGITLTENDNSLSIALGITEKGTTLTNLTASYGIFNNCGSYYKPKYIKKITDENGKLIYQDNNSFKQVFSEETAYIINDMLRYCVTNGTAKKLSHLNCNIMAKTGTVGNENGNTDAYSISYNSNYILGIRYANQDSSYMSNSISGGTIPTQIASKIWEEILLKEKFSDILCPKNIIKLNIDKISYDNDGEIVIADDNAPFRYVQEEIFNINNVPKEKSSRFSCPVIEKPILSVDSKGIKIQLCLTQYINYIIYRQENDNKIKLYDSFYDKKRDKNEFYDINLKNNTTYSYYIVPYYINKENVKCFGKEMFIGKIKSPTINVDDWFNDELE